MADRKIFILTGRAAREHVKRLVDQAPDGYAVQIGEPTRTLEQNAGQWPVLQAIAAQRQWPVNGDLVWMTDEDWKDVLTAAFRQETVRLARGWTQGVVMLGQRTSKFGQRQFREWMEFLKYAAAELGVDVPPPPAKGHDEFERRFNNNTGG